MDTNHVARHPHTALTIAALATSLASYAIAALLAPPRPETYQ